MAKNRMDLLNQKVILLDKKDIKELTGWGENTVNDLFAHDTSFPAIRIGKKYQIEVEAFLEYLRKGRENKD